MDKRVQAARQQLQERLSKFALEKLTYLQISIPHPDRAPRGSRNTLCTRKICRELLNTVKAFKWPTPKASLDKSLFATEQLRPFQDALAALLVFQNP